MKIKILGPKRQDGKRLWETSDADVVEWKNAVGGEIDEDAQIAFRALVAGRREKFIDPVSTDDRLRMLLPGTILALCRINKLTVNLFGSPLKWDKSQSPCFALLLLQSPSSDWLYGIDPSAAVARECLCTGGEIDLNRMKVVSGSVNDVLMKMTDNKIQKISNVSVHSSGMSFEASCSFEWFAIGEGGIHAPFWLTPFLDTKADTGASTKLYLSLDHEVMRADVNKWSASTERIRKTFRDLSGLLKKNASNAGDNYWTSLDLVSQSTLPKFYWTVPTDGTKTTIDFADGEWQLVIADQAGQSTLSPRGVLTIAPANLKIIDKDGKILVDFFDGVANPDEQNKYLKLSATRNGEEWEEHGELSNNITEYESLALADLLRKQYGLFSPEKENGPHPSTLWACMPITDGFAQLPVLNLTQEHYGNTFNVPDKKSKALLNGAAVFGNDGVGAYTPQDGENPWSITLLNGKAYDGLWTIDSTKRKLVSRSITVYAPDLIFNGFLNISTQLPTAQDFLPGIDNFLSELAMVSLRTSFAEDRFPSPFRVHIHKAIFRKRSKTGNPALLSEWSFSYCQNDAGVYTKLLAACGGVDDKIVPIAWRRHPTAPLIQALPLTQTQQPPSYPSASRQLAPFHFSVEIFNKEAKPTFSATSEAANDWVSINPNILTCDEDWATLKFLPLASLGVPGLIFDPQTTNDLFEKPDVFLPAQLLNGLPYTDEINALAQMPKEKKSSGISVEDPSLVKQGLSLRRESYALHWTQLSEHAELARADAEEMLGKSNGDTTIRTLIEPLHWKVKAQLSLSKYPGVVTLKGVGINRDVVLTGNSALRGISEKFVIEGGQLKLVDGNNADAIEIQAGSMSAAVVGDMIRDQRGVRRAASNVSAKFVTTRIVMHNNAGEKMMTLTSLLEQATLSLDGNSNWNFWFRDLPIGSDGKFLRKEQTDLPEDVNDSLATASKRNARKSYEWRISKPANQKHIKLFGFHFYPLTLESVLMAEDDIASVELIGRIQLPFEDEDELPELGNCVLLTFRKSFGKLQLERITSNLGDNTSGEMLGIFTLRPDVKFFPPRLHWTSFEYENAKNKISISSALEFFSLGARWYIPLDPATFSPGEAFELKYGPVAGSGDNVEVRAVLLKFANNRPDTMHVTFGYTWGTTDIALRSQVLIPVDLNSDLNDGITVTQKIEEANKENVVKFFWLLNGNVGVQSMVKNCTMTNRSIQIEFGAIIQSSPSSPAPIPDLRCAIDKNSRYMLLPGFTIKEDGCHGFGAVFFDVVSNGSGSDFVEKNACLEAVFDCSWGEQLPFEQKDSTKPTTVTPCQVYGSSAGEICAGYTLNRTIDRQRTPAVFKWTPSLLLNGVVEIKNSVSYPTPHRTLSDDLQKVLFEKNSVEISVNEEKILKRIAADLTGDKKMKLSVEGHADFDGSANAESLALKRAEGVKKVLVEKFGLDKKQILTVGYADKWPLHPIGSTSENLNRRVELHPVMDFLPAYRPIGGSLLLDHIRHTMKVLFNQHEVPANMLVAGETSVFMNFGSNASWQFVATVQHRLCDIFVPDNYGSDKILRNDRCWAVVQEVRFSSPQNFSQFANAACAEHGLLRRKKGEPSKIADSADVLKQSFPNGNTGLYDKSFLNLLIKKRNDGDDEITALKNALIVEASAVHQLLTQPVKNAAFTDLQFLPAGVQQAILSVPADFEMKDTRMDSWAVASMPFLGRLQPDVSDWPATPPVPVLAVDPILWLHFYKNAPNHSEIKFPIALALTSRGNQEDVSVTFSTFDFTRFRRFRRLDQRTVMENWFRIQNPPLEKSDDLVGKKLISVTASLASNSPSRLSRETILRSLFDDSRTKFLPDSPTKKTGVLITRPLPSELKFDKRNDVKTLLFGPYNFYTAAFQIHSLKFERTTNNIVRFPAVTFLPVDMNSNGGNPMPVTFAVSPYLGLNFNHSDKIADDDMPTLVLAELISTEHDGSNIVPLASRLWDQETIDNNYQETIESWAEEVKSRIASDSPLGVIRIRKAFLNAQNQNPPVIRYSFALLRSVENKPLTIDGAGQLRMRLNTLRYAEGHFTASELPVIREFELAPPVINGMQSLYIDAAAWNDALEKDSSPKKTDPALLWHWGLSGLRLTTTYTRDKSGVVGDGDRLWWSSIPYHVQFDASKNSAGSLPAKFRAKAINHLLPVIPEVPLPGLNKDLEDKKQNESSWKPVLPGSLNVLFVGGRAGVPFVFRSMLVTQDRDKKNSIFKDKSSLVSGGVAVQHRFPRPVAIPKNVTQPINKIFAPLQTWASFELPNKTLAFSNQPIDNACIIKADGINEAFLNVLLESPISGMLSDQFDGLFKFLFNGVDLVDRTMWNIEVSLQAKEKVLPLFHHAIAKVPDLLLNFYVPKTDVTSTEVEVERLKEFLNGCAHGEKILAVVAVKEASEGQDTNSDAYSQRLVFPMRYVIGGKSVPAFRYSFCQFEDPEYNRRLSSEGLVKVREVNVDGNSKKEIIFAADRKRYNVYSTGVIGLFGALNAEISFDHLTAAGKRRKVFGGQIAGNTFAFSLKKMQADGNRFLSGDFILVTIEAEIEGRNESLPVELRLELVDEPVSPTTSSAYALLRKQKKHDAVECVRFAWSPQPARIDLVDPEDLKRGFVRRRAVYQWASTVRYGNEYNYAVQKISSSGATHFDAFNDEDKIQEYDDDE